ncbi:MAG: hypothetical protein ACI845_003398 [Gammaproteobacteria bacterium]|jgi:hypothetical protein
MHLVIALLATLTFFIYLTLQARKNPERKMQMILFLVIDIWLSAVFLYLLFEAITH